MRNDGVQPWASGLCSCGEDCGICELLWKRNQLGLFADKYFMYLYVEFQHLTEFQDVVELFV